MIKTVNLNKVFRDEEIETSALNNVSLHIQKGEFVAIMGPSGCGKSTLLNIIGLLDNPTSGEYYFDGHEVGGFKERNRTLLRKGNIGFVFQSFNLIDELNVYENVELPLIYLKLSAKERHLLALFCAQLQVDKRKLHVFIDIKLIDQVKALEHKPDIAFPEQGSVSLLKSTYFVAIKII